MADERWWVEWRAAGELKRVVVDRRITIGRSRECDVVIDDPYVSRKHCTAEVIDGRLVLDASDALNPIVMGSVEHQSAAVRSGEVFVVGQTAITARGMAAGEDEPTLRVRRTESPARLVLRPSTRQLVDHEGTLIAQFSASEFLAFAALVRRHPDAASHHELGMAVWGAGGWDQYQLHRLLQRIRQRLGDASHLLENVRGAGYRLREAVRLA
jgi:Inner membrane component of T3SS, cytoplasmic domain/Transcriptional regulatory protein, C terminal